MILPVQRIPRYTLLLQELVKKTWEDHPDHGDLIQAQQKMKSIAEYINEVRVSVRFFLHGRKSENMKIYKKSEKFKIVLLEKQRFNVI